MGREHRVIFVVAAAAAPAYNAWWKANIDPAGDTFTVPLNATGNAKDAPVAYWACMTLTETELWRIAKKLAQLSGLSTPTTASTRADKLAWLGDNKATILASGKCRFKLLSNNAAAVNPSDLLTAAGIKPIAEAQTKEAPILKPVGV